MRLRRRMRLTDSDRFQQVREDGRSWVHPLLVLCALPSDLPYSRFGISVSRWVGKAVERNRVKRRLREAIRGLWEGVPAGWDMVFVARPPLKGQPFGRVTGSVSELLRRADLLLEKKGRGESP
ncbi:MAG: ribonuclease P protein component [Chloroflexota bacterium]|nr:ribonuclease P protein component [Chloroflexota bacterium]